jgi:hypothetical protein
MRTLLVPFAESIVPEVQLAQRRLLVALPEGLLDLATTKKLRRWGSRRARGGGGGVAQRAVSGGLGGMAARRPVMRAACISALPCRPYTPEQQQQLLAEIEQLENQQQRQQQPQQAGEPVGSGAQGKPGPGPAPP